MSHFDTRMLAPSSSTLYFQLIPTAITLDTPPATTLLPQSSQLIFKLYSQLQQLQDQLQKPVTIVFNHHHAIINRVYLNFKVPVRTDHCHTLFLVKVFLVQSNFHQGNNRKQDSNAQGAHNTQNGNIQKQQLHEIGTCKLSVNTFINQFQNKNIKQFHQICKLNDHSSLKFSLYLQKSRFSLQRYVRKSRIQHQNITVNSQISQFQIHSHFKSNRLSQIDQPRFISADKRIINDKKLITRSHSSTKKSNCSIDQQINQKNQSKTKTKDKNKFFIQINCKQQNPSQIQQSFQKTSMINQPPQKIMNNSTNFLKVCQVNNQLKIDSSLRTSYKSNNQSQEKSPISSRSIRSAKSQRSQVSQRSNKSATQKDQKQPPSNHMHESKKQDQQKNQSILHKILHSKIFIALFVAISFAILLKIMTPKKKGKF